MHSQQLDTMEKILAAYQEKDYVLLLAPMQSGKTGTFKLVACEMLRQNLVDQVVIFSGNRETDLRDQSNDHLTFALSYNTHLRKQGHEVNVQDLLQKITVVWGPNLKDFTPVGRILYIWEESHYGQSQKQQVDQFLTRVGIQSTGLAPEGCFVLSVSATPFSEFSDNYHLTQNKTIVRLIPPESYMSVEKLRDDDKIHSFIDTKKQFKKLVRHLRGYGLVRASEKVQADLIPIALANGCEVIHYDLAHKETPLNEILARPAAKTIVFIKGMCRMGKVVHKTNVAFAMETSKGKTDTILQGLLGRFCGYDTSGTHVYIKNLDMDEIQRFIDMHNGIDTTPVRGTNIISVKVKTRVSIIPIRFARDDDEDDDIKGAGMADIVRLALDRIENHNNNKYIVPIIQRICAAKLGIVGTNPEDAPHFKFHRSGKTRLGDREEVRLETLKHIRHAFLTKTCLTRFGAGYGASDKFDEVIVHQDRDYNYIIMYVPYDTELRPTVPHTTRREVFCRETSLPIFKGAGGFTCKIKETTRTDSAVLERTLNACTSFAKTYGEDFEEYPNRITNNGTDCIILTEEVFAELESMEQRFRDKGIILNWKKKKGRKPVGCNDVRLSEISWAFTKAIESRMSVAEHVLDQ